MMPCKYCMREKEPHGCHRRCGGKDRRVKESTLPMPCIVLNGSSRMRLDEFCEALGSRVLADVEGY